MITLRQLDKKIIEQIFANIIYDTELNEPVTFFPHYKPASTTYPYIHMTNTVSRPSIVSNANVDESRHYEINFEMQFEGDQPDYQIIEKEFEIIEDMVKRETFSKSSWEHSYQEDSQEKVHDATVELTDIIYPYANGGIMITGDSQISLTFMIKVSKIEGYGHC